MTCELSAELLEENANGGKNANDFANYVVVE
jgi:hypothetical protein